MRRPRIAVAVLLAMLAAGLGTAWWGLRQPLSAEEQGIVGTWTYRWDGHPGDLGLEYEFRADRTCRIRTFDPKTGAPTGDSADATWRLSGGTLTVRLPAPAAGSPWHLFPSRRAAEEVCVLTPDGPDRFRYRGVVEVRSAPTGPPVTGTMTRVRPAE